LICIEAYQRRGDGKMPINYADADDQRVNIIPAGTYKLKAEVAIGNYGADNTLMLARNGRSMHVQMICTVVADVAGGEEYAGRKVWEYFTVELDETVQPPLPTKELGRLRRAVRIGRSKIKAIINSARGLNPDDKSEATEAKRAINTHEDLTGMIFWAELKEEPARGEYKASNKIDYIVEPGDADYPKATAQSLAVAPAKTTTGNGGAPAKPSSPPSKTTSSPKDDDFADEIPF
jgi:hypothetical protein